MMNPTNTPRRNTKRALGLGLAVLSMSLVGTVSRADNLTAGGSVNVPVNSGVLNTVVTSGNTKYFKADLFANRSYEISIYPPSAPMDAGVAINGTVRLSTNQAFTALVTVTQTQSAKEGSMNNSIDFCCLAKTVYVTPVTSTVHYIEIPTNFSNGNMYVSVRETTLFSPWLSKAAGFEGFIELHNNTNAAINVTLKGYDSAGLLQGAGLTFSIPSNATVFKTGADIGVPVGVAAGVVLTHDASFGAISGNITTLNGANGLSFDSAFTPRTEYIRQH